MRALRALTIANVRSFVRDRAALFWTLAFPLIFIFLFGFIFEGSGGAGLDVAKLPELACALECTLTWLVGLTDTPGRWQPDGKHWPRHTQPTTREVAATVPPLPSERVTLNGTPPILGPVEF